MAVRELRDNTSFPDTYKEYMGLSTDQKPTVCGVNSLFYELDTKKVYYFDGTQWAEVGGQSGGGGEEEILDTQ